MLATERQNCIINEIKKNGGVRVETLATQFDVSLMTIRRDLRTLCDNGLIERCYGGAVIKLEKPYSVKKVERSDEKKAIAKQAASLIHNGDTIFFDAGTTTFEILKFIQNYKDITIITNDLKIAYYSTEMNMDVIICGGKIQHSTSCMLGRITNYALKNMKFDIAFMGAASIDYQYDVLTPTETKAEYKQIVLDNSNCSYLLVDSTKFNKIAMIKINNLKDYTGIITTYKFTETENSELKDKNINIISVNI